MWCWSHWTGLSELSHHSLRAQRCPPLSNLAVDKRTESLAFCGLYGPDTGVCGQDIPFVLCSRSLGWRDGQELSQKTWTQGCEYWQVLKIVPNHQWWCIPQDHFAHGKYGSQGVQIDWFGRAIGELDPQDHLFPVRDKGPQCYHQLAWAWVQPHHRRSAGCWSIVASGGIHIGLWGASYIYVVTNIEPWIRWHVSRRWILYEWGT